MDPNLKLNLLGDLRVIY